VGQAKKKWKEINVGVDEGGLTGFFEYFYFRAWKQYPRLRMTSGLNGYVLSAGDARESLSWCPVGKKLVVGADGKVHPCVLLMEEPFCLGDIREKSFEAMFRDSRLEELTENIALRREKIEACRRCTWRNFCESGCAGLAVEKEGTLWATDGICEFRKRLYRESVFGLARGTAGQGEEGVEECD
jgi:radical SAM protein with 4Fe4S-binding SPASM domain